MNLRKDRARDAVRDAGLPQHHVARRLLAESVSLNWDIACEAAECMAYLFREYREAIKAREDARDEAVRNVKGQMDRLEDAIHAAHAERDAARRDFCEILARHESAKTPQRIAERRGWDCYQEATND
jgi:hypothetical protein